MGKKKKSARRTSPSRGAASNQTRIYEGVRKDPLDLRDLPFEGSLRQLPLSIDHRSRVPFVLDQGEEGACTGFGLAAVVNFLLSNHSDESRHPQESVSPRMLYELAKRYDEWEGKAYDGSSIRGAMKGWRRHGVCTQRLWPYREGRAGSLTPEAQLDALSRPLGNYFRVRHRHLEHMHAALAEAGILYASARVHKGWNKVDSRTGRIPFTLELVGAHAFAIVGYDLEGFWVQNSWGDDWGLDGFCRISYDDWIENGMDCWVARLGVPTKSLAVAGPGTQRRVTYFDYIPHEEVVLSAIRPHFINLGNDGQFSESGRYSSEPREVEEVVQSSFDEQTTAWGGTPKLMLYAHGGLNDEKESATRIASLLPYFLGNEVYPLHFMWETGFGDTLTGIIEDAFRRGPLRSWRDAMRDRFLDLIDEAIELGSRPLGKPMWAQIKQNAESASRRRGGAHHVAGRLADYARQNRMELHLVGHSAGGVFHGHLVPVLLRLGLKIKTLTLFAPACSMELFETNLLAHLGRGIDRITVFNLTDRAEQDDSVGPAYHKSLLYFVSEALEERKGTPLAGMDKYWGDDSAARRKLGAPVFQNERGVVYSAGSTPRVRLMTDSGTHGGFDNDEDTLNSMLRIILGTNRMRKPFIKT
ncbi:MAG: C1 family peptidase [Gammaproteobacteria bacterium]|nr:C1 family peptidase [Gammaproteobacteria bacterium]MDJ0890258.1 C1 family peptidase [Gammaproteobacteria bacterium]